ncbi:hypothetical protein ACR78Z_04375 [Sphingobacterium thalpophilum]
MRVANEYKLCPSPQMATEYGGGAAESGLLKHEEHPRDALRVLNYDED